MTDPFDTVSSVDPPRPSAPLALRERLAGLWVARSWSLARVGVTALVVAAVVAMAGFLLRPPGPPVESQLPMAPGVSGDRAVSHDAAASSDPPGTEVTPGAGPSGDADAGSETVTVHAAGAVIRPGVYRVPVTARVVDLVDLAGGLAPDADPDRLNLAALLTDGARIWVPRRGEEQPPTAVNGDTGAPAEPGTGGTGPPGPSSPLDLNAATAADLDTLPGIGPATAEAIIEHRSTNGPFRSVDELIDVRGIGEAKLADLRDRVRV